MEAVIRGMEAAPKYVDAAPKYVDAANLCLPGGLWCLVNHYWSYAAASFREVLSIFLLIWTGMVPVMVQVNIVLPAIIRGVDSFLVNGQLRQIKGKQTQKSETDDDIHHGSVEK